MKKACPLVAMAVVLAWAGPAPAQQQPAAPPDLAAIGRDALDQINNMTPEQRAAAAAKAKAQVPALVDEASQWWTSLTPEQQAAYRTQLKGLLAPPKQ